MFSPLQEVNATGETMPLSFDPKASLFHPDHPDRSIAHLPHTHSARRALLRWHTLFFEDQTAERAVSLAQTQRSHLSAIENETDIRIPEHETFVGWSPDTPGMLAVYNLVEFVPHTPIESSPQNASGLLNALKPYYQWVKDSSQPHVMADIASTYQYGLDEHDRLTLLDIQPLLRPIDRHKAPAFPYTPIFTTQGMSI